MRVALAQIITGRDLAGNLALVEDYARRAKAGGAELVVFPEATMRAFGNRCWTSPSRWTARGHPRSAPSPRSWAS